MVTLSSRWRPPEALVRAAFVLGIVVLGIPLVLRALGFDISPAVEGKLHLVHMAITAFRNRQGNAHTTPMMC